jgi:hypothetical protein
LDYRMIYATWLLPRSRSLRRNGKPERRTWLWFSESDGWLVLCLRWSAMKPLLILNGRQR